MTSPYRSEQDALRERKENIESELSRLKAQTTELEGLRAREGELEGELRAIGKKLGGQKRLLPLLEQMQIASPCSANWNEMVGDDRVRYCLSCEKNVFNLSAMPRDEAEHLLQERSQGEVCVRFYQRADGTVMTADCPVGVKRKRRKKLALAVAGAGAMAVAAMAAFEHRAAGCRTMQGAVGTQVMQGEPTFVAPTTTTETAQPTAPAVMGSFAAPPPPPPPALMGRRVRPNTK